MATNIREKILKLQMNNWWCLILGHKSEQWNYYGGDIWKVRKTIHCIRCGTNLSELSTKE